MSTGPENHKNDSFSIFRKVDIWIYYNDFRGPPRQATGPTRSGARVGVGILSGTIMFEDLKDSKNWSSKNTKIPQSTINYSKSIEVFSKLF